MNSKPDIHCITFGGGSKRFRAAAHRLARQAAASGFFTAATAVTDLELLEDEQFRAEHGAFAASNRRGFGYWIWKPYILLRKLRNVRDGDIVFYCDAGCEINPLGAKVFAEYVRLLQQNEVLLFRLSQLNEHWTKGDLLDLYPQLAGKRHPGNIAPRSGASLEADRRLDGSPASGRRNGDTGKSTICDQ